MAKAWKGLLLLVLVVGGVLAWQRLRTEAPIPVTTVGVEPGLVAATVTNSRAGTVKARRRAKISPELGGRAIAIPFREGDRVRAGDVLLRLDLAEPDARLRLAQEDQRTAEAQREQACLGAERSARERDRLSRLAKEGIVSPDALDAASSQTTALEAACRAAGAASDRARAAVAVVRAETAKMVLVAPFDGIIADVSIEIGEWTTPSPPTMPVPAVIDLIDTASLYVSAPMDEVDSARIRAGQKARVTVDSHRNQSFPGRVLRVAPFVEDREEQNRTVEVEVELDDAAFASTLLPGTSADVEIVLEERTGVPRIPTGALLSGNKVLVLEGGLLVERDLSPGLGNWDFTEVAAGLRVGERVVTSLDRPEVKAGARAVEAPAGAGGAGP